MVKCVTMPKDFIPEIARAFPVCTSSDEFPAFPQFASAAPDWAVWDDFSERNVLEFSDRLAAWEGELAAPADGGDTGEVSVDARLARRLLRTLREQLTVIGPQRSQPTFHLTVASIGLAEALESPDPEAWRGRIRGLPAFLERAASTLGPVPRLFREMGEEMTGSFRAWLEGLEDAGYDTGSSPEALGRFERAMGELLLREDFVLSDGGLERVVSGHLGCGGGVEKVLETLSEESAAMVDVLEGEAGGSPPARAGGRLHGTFRSLKHPGAERRSCSVRNPSASRSTAGGAASSRLSHRRRPRSPCGLCHPTWRRCGPRTPTPRHRATRPGGGSSSSTAGAAAVPWTSG